MSVESHDIKISICDFLSGIIDYVGATNTNHNIKSWRYQILGGFNVLRVGEHVIDQHILTIAGVEKDLWKPSDFASGVVVLKLMSIDILRKIEFLIKSNQRDFSDVEAGIL